MRNKRQMECNWQGPFGWPKYGPDLDEVPKTPGVYLETVEYESGYLIYGAGITCRSVRQRIQEHTRKYEEGHYFVLDASAMRLGLRKEIWPGFWTENPEREMQREYERRESEIQRAVKEQLRTFRIFTTRVEGQKRTLERLEAAIMQGLYDDQPLPFRDLPDKGMYLVPRRENERPIWVKNKSEARLFGLPRCLEI